MNKVKALNVLIKVLPVILVVTAFLLACDYDYGGGDTPRYW
jgi:hypothetical protein